MPARIALLVVDVQKAFDDAGYWSARNNPDCERNVAVLIAAWREQRQPVVFVRHDSDEDGSPRLELDGWTAPLDIADEPITEAPDAAVAPR